MLRFLSTVLAVIVGLFLFVFLFVFAIAAIAGAGHGRSAAKKPMPKTVVVELDLRQKIEDADAVGGMPHGFGGDRLSVVGIVDGLQKATTDTTVKGLYVRSGSSFGLLPAQVQEIRSAIADFKKSGKFVITHFQDLMDPGLGGYYLASVGSEVWMQPTGGIMSSGLGSSGPFFKGTLQKLDSSAQVLNYYEYKTALHPLINDDYTAAQKEEDMRLLQSIFDSFAGEIAPSRGMKVDEFKTKLGGVPYIGEEARKAGFVDKLGFDVDAEDAAKAKAGTGAEIVEFADYAERAGSTYAKGSVIALIEGDGMVVDGKDEGGLFGPSGVLAGDTVSKAILDAANDKDVQAIVFRVNSPGGSATASDQVWNAIERAQKKGKPVVINMSGVAASGGYWVAMGADKIIAEPTTITGSIGVVGGKLILKGLYQKLGINVGELSVGSDKQHMFSVQHPFSPSEFLALQKVFDAVYGDFTRKVSDGRKIPLEKVRELAKGRVWVGTDAKDRNLVDEFGGLKTALASAKALAKLTPDAAIELKRFPSKKSFFEQIFSAMGTSARVAHTLSLVAQAFDLQPAAAILEEGRREQALQHNRVQAITDPIDIH
jgi:protease-4